MIGFDLAQTFYVDKDAVLGSDTAFITAVDLFFYAKPVAGKTKTGITKPGVSVYLCGTSDIGAPDLTVVHHTFAARVEYDNINDSTLGATATTFTFRQPIPVPTNKSYGLLVKFDGSDDDFKLWYNKAGENVLGTLTKTQVSSGKVDGNFYVVTNGKDLTPMTDADLSFNLYVAKFTSLESTFKLKNRPYEILKVTNRHGKFFGGEDVYVAAANSTGTVRVSNTSTTLTGNGTSFNTVLSVGDKFVITDGTAGNTDIRTVAAITNSTSITVDAAPTFTNTTSGYYKTVIGKMFADDGISDFVIVQDSNTNTSLRMSTGSTLKGADSLSYVTVNTITDFAVNSVIPGYVVKTPAGTTANVTVNFSNVGYSMTTSNKLDAPIGRRQFINLFDAVIASHDNEVNTSSTFASFNSELVFRTENPYSSPYVREENLDVYCERFDVNNTDTNEYLGRGSAKARYISRSVNLEADQRAEDIKVYIRAYKPYGTDVKAYVKFRNSEDPETLDIKDWTELTVTTNGDNYSNPSNIYDTLEFEYSVPSYNSGTTFNGTFTTTSGNAVAVSTSTTVNTSIAVGNIVRLYSPLTPNTYLVDTVTAANTTTITLGSVISNNSLVGTGFKLDVVSRPNSGYIDAQNRNVLTYFNGNGSKFQSYDSFVIKLVLLSSDGRRVPFVDDVRAIAVSA